MTFNMISECLYLISEVLTAVNINAAVFWDVTLGNLMAGVPVIQRNLLPLSSLSYIEEGGSGFL
jgi:hypothetical protein